jgi:hypothetical protein
MSVTAVAVVVPLMVAEVGEVEMMQKEEQEEEEWVEVAARKLRLTHQHHEQLLHPLQKQKYLQAQDAQAVMLYHHRLLQPQQQQL